MNEQENQNQQDSALMPNQPDEQIPDPDMVEDLQHVDESENFNLSDIFNIEPETSDAVTPPQPPATAVQPQAAVQPQQNIDWESRYKELQSFKDKQIGELNQKINMVGSNPEEIANLRALRDVISNDPEMLDYFSAKIQGGTSPQQRPPSNVATQIPPRPQEFDPLEIYDPNTPSGQWYQQVENSRLDQLKTDLLTTIDQKLNQIPIAIEQRLETKERQKQIEAKSKTDVDNFLQKHPEVTQDFFSFVQQGPGNTVTLDHLYDFYKIVRGGNGTQPPVVQPNPQSALNTKIIERSTPTPNVSQVTSGQNNQPETDESSFVKSMLSRSQKRQIF